MFPYKTDIFITVSTVLNNVKDDVLILTKGNTVNLLSADIGKIVHMVISRFCEASRHPWLRVCVADVERHPVL